MKTNLLLISLILFLGCTNEILLPDDEGYQSPPPEFETTYFNYNNVSNELFIYCEIVNYLENIDSVRVEILDSQSEVVFTTYLEVLNSGSNNQYSMLVYSTTQLFNTLESGVFYAHYYMYFNSAQIIESISGETYLSSISEPIAPEIILINMPEIYELHATQWTLLPIEITVIDSNGQSDINQVEYEILRWFNPCEADNNGDGSIDEGNYDDDYSNFDYDNWVLQFESFGQNNSFIYSVEIPMRPSNGSALLDEYGNIIHPATDCGKTGDMSFRFTVTDGSGLQDIETDVYLVITAP